MSLIIAVSLLMCLGAVLAGTPAPPAGDYGLCFPSPQAWGIPYLWGEAVNVVLIFASAMAFFLINKRFRLLKTSQPLGASFFIPLCCADPIISGRLTAAPILLAVLLTVLIGICSSWRSRNATQETFITATLLSVGSMIQYAFVPFVVAATLSFVAMKAMRFREAAAMILGLVAPYWIAIGFGIVDPFEIRMPHIDTLFTSPLPRHLFLTLLGCGVMLLVNVVLTLSNGLRLFAGNAEIRSYINVINIFGATAALAAVFDIDNFSAYLAMFHLWTALQIALFFTLRNIRRSNILFWTIQALILIYSIILIFLNP